LRLKYCPVKQRRRHMLRRRAEKGERRRAMLASR
jgi:hypothetical protein